MTRILLAIFIIFYQLSHAAEQTIIAVVNDAPITKLDLQHRVDLVRVSNNLPNNTKSLEIIRSQVLQMLIDEKLFEQEAKRLNITVDTLDVKHTLHMIAENNHLTFTQLDTFLKQSNISKRELENQITHQLLWSKLIKTQIDPFISVSEQDLKDFYKYKPNSQSVKEKVKLAEIALFPNQENYHDAELLMEQLSIQASAGQDFSKLARNFSQSSSAKQGGDIGWFYTEQLSNDFASAIVSLSPEGITAPIKSKDSLYLIKVLDKKIESISALHQETSNDKFREMLKQQKSDIQVKGYLLNLRNQAFIKLY